MNDFVFQSPTRFVFGKSAIERTGEEVAALGSKRVLLVYGGGSARRTGLLSRVEDSLAKAGVAYVELGGVRPNPEVDLVRQGIEVARANSVGLVLGVGGGSVIDSAKAIAFGAPAPCDVWDFFSGKAKVTKCLPVACVLTIPAAGSEASSSCVISNDELCLKKGTNGDAFRPKVAIMDPTVTFTLPAYQTAAGVTDMICHVCERYFSAAGPVPVTDSICCGIIRSVIEAAVRVSHTPDDYDARATIMWAGTLAHNDLCGCGRGASIEKRAGGWESHGLEHEVSAHRPEVTHGAGLAVILPAWMRYVWRANPDRFLAFARDVFGIEPRDTTLEETERVVTSAIGSLQDFFASIGMPRDFEGLGLSPDEVDGWVETLRENKGEPFGEFRPLTMEDARAIYLSCF
ncbi:iron-containing alcohol dehydrogenase [Olsenella sp. YH-ols2223]|uniref:Iron-containing alcohol dehydrogenase n=1 Tax=Olsenella absiana TaxID=3115222 RepID=A0ABU7R7L4_9ACTN